MQKTFRYSSLLVLLWLASFIAPDAHAQAIPAEIRIGIIGLDTSHSIAFTRLFHDADNPEMTGFRVVAAYPQGSTNLEASYRRIPQYTEDIQELGVEIAGSIGELLDKVDVVLLETNDGHPRLEQALQVIRAGKPLFVDKPIAASLADAIKIYDAADKAGVPIFSASGLRFMASAQAVRQGSIGQVLGADTFSPAPYEPSHPDLFWYGIHGVETLFTVMGAGCETVQRTHTEDTDVIVCVWNDGRIGTVRGIREGEADYGGSAFGSEDIARLGPFEGYGGLVSALAQFFRTGVAPVSREETMEIYAFMEAADESKRRGGAAVKISGVLREATAKARAD